MTREEAIECAIWALTDPYNYPLDYQDFLSLGQKPEGKIASEILQNSLLIPKPKFKVGDVVKHKDGSYWEIDEYLYDPKKKEWFYYTKIFWRKFYESELKIREAAK